MRGEEFGGGHRRVPDEPKADFCIDCYWHFIAAIPTGDWQDIKIAYCGYYWDYGNKSLKTINYPYCSKVREENTECEAYKEKTKDEDCTEVQK